MTESEATHRAEQMEAARAEFKIIFDSAKETFVHDWKLNDHPFVEMICWRVFLKAKGLSK